MSSPRLFPVLLLVACAHGSAVRVSSSSEFTRIAPGKSYFGTEDRVDPKAPLPFLGPTKFRFFGQVGQRVRFKYTTSATDGFARELELTRLSDEAKVPLAHEDGEAFLTGTAVLPVDGEFELRCSPGVTDRASADYTLEFTADVTPPVLAIAEKQTIKGELTADDRTDLADRPTDLYRIEVPSPGKRLAFVARAPGSKLRVAVLAFTDGEFPELEADGWGNASDEAHVTYVRQHAFIMVTGPADRPLGPYELTVMDGRAYQLSTLDLVRLGGVAEGEVGPRDSRTQDAVFRVHGKVGQVYELTASSDTADLVLVVTNAELLEADLRVVVDDDSGGGTNPRIRLVLPDEIDWMVLVRNKSNTPGRFKLSFDVADLRQQGPAPQKPQVIRR